ncbi:heavy metal-associated isoprenylated plant protein 47-like [Neltuma alba]|uniref:heavy metal-associated isoprenylated plant protein 47-like n=1 Tax=Neltuma alba TaxID=207710 RepID=UPI0010A35F97|nr:heavy metal-associated isoprenylated plant protein 47-like [Prosopis alba]XP_028761352.1 heavy metal-associated isoprenylated plant protein 47-like [Prosopis alba]
MKQKIVIKATLDCNKCRSKALTIAAAAKGVSSVSIEGRDRDQVVVVGDDVDPVCLARLLRKKFRHASILSVQQLKQESKEEKNNKEEDYDNKVPPYCPTTHHYPPYPISSCHVVHDPYPTSFCSIL